MTETTLGQLLRQADERIQAALVTSQDETARLGTATRELRRIFTTMARCLDDRVPFHAVEVVGRIDLSPWERAAVQARTAMRQAARNLAPATGPDDSPDAGARGRPARHLDAAATYLAAGRDLLNSHLSTGPSGQREARSEWGDVVTSPAVTRALTTQMARWTRRLAPLAASLAAHPAADQGELASRDALHLVTHWLWAAGTSFESAQKAEPVTTDDLRLLNGIPATRGPVRPLSAGEETVAELCGGIIDSAERVRLAVFGTAEQASWAPGATASTWRWTAQAAAVIGHAGEQILRTLASNPGQPGTQLVAPAFLTAAANAVARSWAAWRQVRTEWQGLTTETQGQATRTTAEIGDLVLRTGRLAWNNPNWTPARRSTAEPRPAADLAADADGLKANVAAVHQAADALARLAGTNLEAVQIADDAARLYVQTRSLPMRYNIPRPYATAPTDRVEPLLHAYQTAVQTSTEAARALGDLAITVDAPSTALALARATARPYPGQPTAPDQHLPDAAPYADHLRQTGTVPGPVEQAVKDLRVYDPIVLLRAVTIDTAATNLIKQASRMSRNPGTQATNQAGPEPRGHRSAVRLAAKDNPRSPAVRPAGTKPRTPPQAASRPPGSSRAPGPTSRPAARSRSTIHRAH